MLPGLSCVPIYNGQSGQHPCEARSLAICIHTTWISLLSITEVIRISIRLLLVKYANNTRESLPLRDHFYVSHQSCRHFRITDLGRFQSWPTLRSWRRTSRYRRWGSPGRASGTSATMHNPRVVLADGGRLAMADVRMGAPATARTGFFEHQGRGNETACSFRRE